MQTLARRAGSLEIDQSSAAKRIASLLIADPHLPIADAFAFVTGGMYLGTFERRVTLAVFAELAHIRAEGGQP